MAAVVHYATQTELDTSLHAEGFGSDHGIEVEERTSGADSIERLYREGKHFAVFIGYRDLDWSAIGSAMKCRLVIDGRNILPREDLHEHGFRYRGIGRTG